MFSRPETEQLTQLQTQADVLIRKIEHELRRKEKLTVFIREVRQRILAEKRKKRGRGGVDASARSSYLQQKELRLLEQRHNKLHIRLAEECGRNDTMRSKVDRLRRLIMLCDSSESQLRSKLASLQERIGEVMESSSTIYDEREKAIATLEKLQRVEEHRARMWEEDIRHLDAVIAMDREVQEHVSRSVAARLREETLESSSSAKGKVKRGKRGLTKEDEAYLREQLESMGKKPVGEDRGRPGSKLHTYEEAFNKLRRMTGIEHLPGIVNLFVTREDQNFAIFNHIQYLNSEVEKHASEVAELEEKTLKFKKEKGEEDNERKQILMLLQRKLAKIKKAATEMRKRDSNDNRAMDALCAKVKALFDQIGCASMITASYEAQRLAKLRELSGGGGSVMTPPVRRPPLMLPALEDGDKAVEDILGSKKVMEDNIVQYMGIIEQRANEIIHIYSKAVVSGATELRYGPATPMGPVKVRIRPPEYKDAAGSDSDNEDDEKPVDISELKLHASRSRSVLRSAPARVAVGGVPADPRPSRTGGASATPMRKAKRG
eukprot:PLAT1190.1.p1 GENE.PLAT1190.1~~PLAT1190.1.p1  ORF type:complete len:548 (+),score=242.81 PLAT1190.1:80-1723(+)